MDPVACFSGLEPTVNSFIAEVSDRNRCRCRRCRTYTAWTPSLLRALRCRSVGCRPSPASCCTRLKAGRVSGPVGDSTQTLSHTLTHTQAQYAGLLLAQARERINIGASARASTHLPPHIHKHTYIHIDLHTHACTRTHKHTTRLFKQTYVHTR